MHFALGKTKDETLDHLFFKYNFERAIWFGSQLSVKIEEIQETERLQWLINQLVRLEAEIVGQPSFVVLSLTARNTVIFENKTVNPMVVTILQ